MNTTAKPLRITPKLDETGQPIELNPPSGGQWIRDPDGGLTPADKHTADGAGLAWGAEAALAEMALIEPNDPLANQAADGAPSSSRKGPK
jgi:hypothetical protein